MLLVLVFSWDLLTIRKKKKSPSNHSDSVRKRDSFCQNCEENILAHQIHIVVTNITVRRENNYRLKSPIIDTPSFVFGFCFFTLYYFDLKVSKLCKSTLVINAKVSNKRVRIAKRPKQWRKKRVNPCRSHTFTETHKHTHRHTELQCII